MKMIRAFRALRILRLLRLLKLQRLVNIAYDFISSDLIRKAKLWRDSLFVRRHWQANVFFLAYLHNTSLMEVFVSVHSPFLVRWKYQTFKHPLDYKYVPLLCKICILWLVRTNWFTVVKGFNLARGSLTPVIRWVCFHYDWNASLGDFNMKFWWVGVGGLSFFDIC